jgi:hypothetical protein
VALALALQAESGPSRWGDDLPGMTSDCAFITDLGTFRYTTRRALTSAGGDRPSVEDGPVLSKVARA